MMLWIVLLVLAGGIHGMITHQHHGRYKTLRVVCDVVTLDSALQNSYAEHVLSGKALPINYSTYITQYQTITSSDFTVNVSRSASRLKSVFINFDGTAC
jgi:hypothetical protein